MTLYCPEPLEGCDIHPFFSFRYGRGGVTGLFKNALPPNYFEHEVEYTTQADGAQAIILPNNFLSVADSARAYIAHWADEAERLQIPLFLFSFGDFTDRLQFDPRAHVCKLSLYRATSASHDIIVPTLTEDLGRDGVVVRSKTEIPTVSFCGQAGYQKPLQWVKYYVKVLLHLFTPARQLGVYWRRRMMAVCKSSSLLHTSFIIRRSFSGAHSTIELDPVQARADFIQNIIDTDFVLAPKGDGNYSNRFLEALSVGRIPVVVDTDIVLPLEGMIDYSKIMVRVPMSRVHETPNYIRKFYDALTEEEWKQRQKFARKTFEKYLRQDSFSRYFFTTELKNRIVQKSNG